MMSSGGKYTSNPMADRRTFLKAIAALPLALPMMQRLGFAQAQPAGARGRVSLNVRDFGAKGDGMAKDTLAIQQALDRCWVLGGGEALVPAGDYLTGAVALRANTILRLDKNASILGSADFADYPAAQVRWEGKWIQGRVGLIYAMGADNIGIAGPGRIGVSSATSQAGVGVHARIRNGGFRPK